MRKQTDVGLIHINGLGLGHNKIVKFFNNNLWKRTGFDYIAFDVKWFSGSFDEDLAKITEQAKILLKKKERLAVMGSSAGGSLALNVFASLRDEKLSLSMIAVGCGLATQTI